MERADLGLPEVVRRPTRVDPRPPERLIGVNVPHACERPLVEENTLHRATTPGKPLAEIASGKTWPQWLDAETRCQICVELVRPEDKPRSETPNVPIGDIRSVV